MPATVKIYRYLEAEWGLKTLREKRLKVSNIKGLNDPFEWRVGTIGDDVKHAAAGREAFDEFFDRLNKQFGMISYSAELSDPVIWSHYADKHKGIALQFDHLVVEELLPIVYCHALPTFDVTGFLENGSDTNYTLSVLKMAHGRKSPSWAYEKEYRVHFHFATQCQEEAGIFYKQIPDYFLKRVILGVRCTVTKPEVEHALAEGGLADVEVVQARMSDTSYEILCD
jgi:Protein of unknown function (DUF2971)